MESVALVLAVLMLVMLVVAISVAYVGGRYGEGQIVGEHRSVWVFDEQTGLWHEERRPRVVSGRGEAGEDE